MIGGLMKKISLIAIAAAAAAAFATNASAADLGGDCCADLEERIAELEATTARKGNRKVSLTVSGWVNEAVMFWDDGVESNIYQVTNVVAQTRFRFVGQAKIDDEWSAGYLIEIGIRGAGSDQVNANIDDGTSPNSLAIRHSAWWLNSKRLGKVWVGQTSAATDGIMEINVANVGHFATQNAGAQVGGFTVRGTGLTLRNFMGGGSNTAAQIGEGERHNVVKYETPTIQGFTLSAAYGEDDLWDVALRYAGEFNGVKMAFGVGYSQWTEGASQGGTNEYNCADIFPAAPDVSCQQFGVSGAIMHVPTGLYVHAAYGVRTDDNVLLNDEMSQFYVQGGIERKFFPLGKTTMFVEYQNWDNERRNTELNMWGLGLNQNIEAAAMDLYIRYNNFDADDNNLATNEESFQSVIMGGKINF
ncbi:MAG: porin [Hyphomicrobiaceae bacterium]